MLAWLRGRTWGGCWLSDWLRVSLCAPCRCGLGVCVHVVRVVVCVVVCVGVCVGVCVVVCVGVYVGNRVAVHLDRCPMEIWANNLIDHLVHSYNELNIIIGVVADVCTLLAVGTA